MRCLNRVVALILIPALLSIGAPARAPAAEIPADLDRGAGAPRAERVEGARIALERAGLSCRESERRARSLDERELAHAAWADLDRRGGVDAFAATLAIVLIVVFLFGFFVVAAREDREQAKQDKRLEEQRRDERRKIQETAPPKK